MRRTLWGLSVLGSSCLLAAVTLVAHPPLASSAVPSPMPQSGLPVQGTEREVQALLEKVSELGTLISKNPQSPEAWRYQMEQGEVMLQLAQRGSGKERESWLRVAIDSFYSAAVAAPDNDPTAVQRFSQLPARIARTFPKSPMYSYAMMQEMQAEYMRAVNKAGEAGPTRAQLHYRNRLLHFAWENSNLPDAPKAVLQAAQISEMIGRTEDARKCYRYVVNRYAGQDAARKAAGSLWRLGPVGQPVNLKLSPLFATDSHGPADFDIKELRGKLVLVYFWECGTPQIEDNFQALKRLTDLYRYRGLEVVYVNLDRDRTMAQEFLADQLTAGIHCYQSGCLESHVAQSHGIQSLPHAFLVGKDGKLLEPSIAPSRIETVVASYFPGTR